MTICAVIGIFELANVRDAIHVHLGRVFQKFVHEHRPFRGSLHRKTHVMLKLGIGINDLHRASAEDEGRADEDRIVQFLRHRERLGFVGGQAVGRLRNFQLVEHRGEKLAVLGDLDALGRGADDVDAVFLEAERQVQRRLPAELRNRPPAAFPLVNVQHILERERLEEQFVAGVVIGGDGFRIRVDHQRLQAVLLERKRGMDAAIIKFDALADAVRPAAENHHLLLRGCF